MRKSVSIILLLLTSHYLMAQISISKNNNSMRSGDILCKVEVGYVGGGETGQNVTWHIRQLTGEERDYYQAIMSSSDTVAILEKGTITHFVMCGDTLFLKGNQQRRSFLIYEKTRPVLRYPFAYSDSISGSYTAQGVDENVELSVNGWGYTVADGAGQLTDGTNTLKNVTRIHMFDDYVENYGNQAKLHIHAHRFLWFCFGYRYPVMESIYRTIVEDDISKTPLDSITYLYLPIRQEELAMDIPNDSALYSLAKFYDEYAHSKGSGSGQISSIHAVLSPDSRKISVSYSLSADCELRISAYDVMGSRLGEAFYKNRESGEWQDCIVLNRKPVSNILMLKIRCNNETTSVKVNEK